MTFSGGLSFNHVINNLLQISLLHSGVGNDHSWENVSASFSRVSFLYE